MKVAHLARQGVGSEIVLIAKAMYRTLTSNVRYIG